MFYGGNLCPEQTNHHLKMAPKALENALIEEAARFDGYKELLEDDIGDDNPDDDVFESVRKNQSELKQQYLNLKVAQAKYKAKFVPAAVTEADFNDKDSAYQYSDPWLENMKKEYQSVNKAASTFLKGEHVVGNAAVEQKVQVAAAGEIQKIITKIAMESGQVEGALDDTYKKLQHIVDINPSQAKVYKDLKDDLMDVIDVKIPALIKAITDFAAFEAKEKTRLYRLVQLIAEKTTHSAPQSSGRSSGRSEAVHL